MASILSVSFLFLGAILSAVFLPEFSTASFPAEKKTHLHFFLQEQFNPPNSTVVKVAPGAAGGGGDAASLAAFGNVFIIDDYLTDGPDPSSRLLGRVQGLSAAASISGSDFLLVANFAFTESGPWSGSSLAVLARNPLPEAVRELPVVGGTGKFRLARGYAIFRTVSINSAAGHITVEVDVFVLQY
ncbi:Disease resistance response protein 206 [Apostasia shenzhenica]|uniref:Dirigent protein n=1 Tax=Apostasia shenzhenica TaxID=1088818 RepID=A0A2I0A076_9ASPA|nr:Disease resistance response protein 206 [Apostasia shenzhenica]